MTQTLRPVAVNNAMERLWQTEEHLPCPDCKRLLMAFATARPADFEFLQPSDMIDLNNPAFYGIPEWEAFVSRYSSCQACNEV